MREARSRLVCERVRSQVSLSLDGELSEFERAMVDAHLGRCAPCRVFAARVSALTAQLRAAPLEPLEHRIILPRSRRAFGASVRALQLGAAAAAVMLAVGLGTIVQAVRSDSTRGPLIRISPNPQFDPRHDLIPDHARSRELAPVLPSRLRNRVQQPL